MQPVQPLKPLKPLKPLRPDQLVQIINLSAGYDRSPVFSKFSLSVMESDRILVCGPNGCGKTTLLKCMLGLVKPLSGEIKTRQGLRTAYSKQDFPSVNLPISAQEVVAMGLGPGYRTTPGAPFSAKTAATAYGSRRLTKQKSRQIVAEAMEKTKCLHLARRLFSSLSGGERQRVSLARCLCQKADLLLLDEPSSFLDSESRENLLELLENLTASPFAVIAVTHDPSMMTSSMWRIVRMENAEDGGAR